MLLRKTIGNGKIKERKRNKEKRGPGEKWRIKKKNSARMIEKVRDKELWDT